MKVIFWLSSREAKSYSYAVRCLSITRQKFLPENGVLNRTTVACVRRNFMLKNISGSIP